MLATKRPNTETTQNCQQVESVMKRLVTVYHYEEMTAATDKLVKAKSSPAVVVDGVQKCIGVLTRQNIQRYFRLWIRFLENDESVLPEIFETNAFGMLHIDREFFHQVGKHMTSPVLTIDRTATIAEANDAFDRTEGLEHMVVVNEDQKPIGVLTREDLPALADEMLDTATPCLA